MVGDVTSKLGQYLSDFIKRNGMTEAELARKLGISRSTLNGITKRGISIPQDSFMQKVADVTGIPYYEVLAMVYPRLKSEIDSLLGDMSIEQRRERLQYARAFENLPPDAQARIRAKMKDK
jgi:transcriptional regulator with XRE-family HTH domain